MSETQTPRVDEASRYDGLLNWVVPADLARTLERELSAALARAEKAEAREKLAWDRGHSIGYAQASENERLWAAKDEGLRNEMQQVTDNLLKAEAERDAAIAKVARYETLLRRYRNETPLGHQPHMIAADVDALLPDVKEAK